MHINPILSKVWNKRWMILIKVQMTHWSCSLLVQMEFARDLRTKTRCFQTTWLSCFNEKIKGFGIAKQTSVTKFNSDTRQLSKYKQFLLGITNCIKTEDQKQFLNMKCQNAQMTLNNQTVKAKSIHKCTPQRTKSSLHGSECWLIEMLILNPFHKQYFHHNPN